MCVRQRVRHQLEELTTEYWEANMCYCWACRQDGGILYSTRTLICASGPWQFFGDQFFRIHMLYICCWYWHLKSILCNKLRCCYGGCCLSGALYILISATLNLSSAVFILPVALVFSETLCKQNIKSLERLICYNDTPFLRKRVIAHRHLKADHTVLFYHFIIWNFFFLTSR